MNCQQINKYIYEFCDKQLSPQLQDGVQAHLDQCESCREKVAAASQDGDLLRSLDTIPALRADFTDLVMATVKQKHGEVQAGIRAGRFPRYTREFRWWWGAASAAVLLLALCSLPMLDMQMPLGSKITEQDATDSVPAEKVPLLANHPVSADSAVQPPQEANVKEYAAQTSPGIRQDSAVKSSTASPERRQPVSAAQPYTAAILTDQMVNAPVYTSPNRGTELLTLHPANLPPEYSLRAIISNSDQEITFVYLNQLTQEELKLQLTVPTQPAQKPSPAEDASPQVRSAVPKSVEGSGENSSVKTAPTANSYKARVEHNRQSYEMVLSSNLDDKQMASLADAIKLEEGIPDVKTENP